MAVFYLLSNSSDSDKAKNIFRLFNYNNSEKLNSKLLNQIYFTILKNVIDYSMMLQSYKSNKQDDMLSSMVFDAG
jgi:hypothetical protein